MNEEAYKEHLAIMADIKDKMLADYHKTLGDFLVSQDIPSFVRNIEAIIEENL